MIIHCNHYILERHANNVSARMEYVLGDINTREGSVLFESAVIFSLTCLKVAPSEFLPSVPKFGRIKLEALLPFKPELELF